MRDLNHICSFNRKTTALYQAVTRVCDHSGDLKTFRGALQINTNTSPGYSNYWKKFKQ